jgi:hypothetical protein
MVESDQFKEIVSYLSKNRESRVEALNIILSFSTTVENRQNWTNTDVIKELLRTVGDFIGDEKITSTAF